jgi:Rrf2 family protein
MSFKKSTRYALYAALEMASAGEGRQVTAAQVAERYTIPVAVLAKVFQQLVRAGIAIGTRGTRGGYSLARQPSEMTVLDVIETFEPPRREGQCLLASNLEDPCDQQGLCRLRKLFDEVEESSRNTYASVTLETLAGNRSDPDRGLRIVK